VIAAACGRTGASLTVTDPLQGFDLALAGAHQQDNAGIAVEAARLLVPVDHARGPARGTRPRPLAGEI